MYYFLPGIPLECIRIPFQTTEQHPFPFPFVPETLTFPHIFRHSRTSTSVNSATQSAALVNTFPDDAKLHKLLLSDELFDNLIAYASPSRRLPDSLCPFDTLMLNNGTPDATPVAINHAIYSMSIEAQAIQLRGPCYSNSQLWTQNHIVAVMLPITDHALAQRYDLTEAGGHPLPRENVPRWRTNTMRYDFRPVPGTIESPAGLADAILDAGAGGTANAVLHCKPSWVYSHEVLESVFVDGDLQGEDGLFAYNSGGVPANMMRQLWGSMVTMACRFAVWSNGEEVFFAIRFQGVLVCTPPRPWSHRDTVLAVIGITYAALDEVEWLTRHVDLPIELAGDMRLII